MNLSERLRAPDSFGLLLLLVLLTMVSVAAGEWPAGRMLAVVMLDGSLLFAMHTSRASRTMLRFGVVLAILAFVAGGAAVLVSGYDTQLMITSMIAAVLVLSAILAIVRRLTVHPVVSGATILGALCVYVLIGMFFASLFGIIDAFGVLFVQGNANSVDYLYFSYVTLATVGYGDLTAKGDLARMLAVTEALTGQLYLVSVVALVVGNLGRTRRPRDRSEDRDEVGPDR
jgi:hypothetical protein